MNNDARTELREALIRKIQSGTATPDERLQLFRSMERFCERIAGKYKTALRCSDEVADLIQEGYICVQTAAETYDPDGGASFSNWVAFYLHTAFNRYVAEENGLSRGVHERKRRIHHFEAEYEAINRRKPTDKAICRALGIGLETIQKLRQAGGTKSLDAEISEDLTVGDMVEDPVDMESTICDRLVMEEVRKKLRGYVNELLAHEREAVIMFYYNGIARSRCAELLRVNQNTFNSWLRRAVNHLATQRHIRELGRFLPERLGSSAYGGGDSTMRTALKLIEHQEMKNLEKGMTKNED